MIRISVDKDLDELVIDLCTELNPEDLLELVKQINAEVADYDFTKELKDYFTKEIEDEDAYDIDED